MLAKRANPPSPAPMTAQVAASPRFVPLISTISDVSRCPACPDATLDPLRVKVNHASVHLARASYEGHGVRVRDSALVVVRNAIVSTTIGAQANRPGGASGHRGRHRQGTAGSRRCRRAVHSPGDV